MFPSVLPSYTAPDPNKTLDQDNHTARHNQEELDIIALAGKLGVGASVASAGTILRGTGAGTSAFGQLDFTTDVAPLSSAALRAVLTDETGAGAAVFGTAPTLSNPTITGGGSWAGSPTITTPTIASLTNAQHNHSNAAGGGQLTSSAFADGAIPFIKTSGIWWEELGRTALVSAGDTISVASLPTRKYLMVLINLIPIGSIAGVIRFNNDSGNNYAIRYDNNNGTTGTALNNSNIGNLNGGNENVLAVAYIANIAAREKIVNVEIATTGASGAGNAPGSVELKAKWANTSAAISRIDIINIDTGDFAIGSELVILGHD